MLKVYLENEAALVFENSKGEKCAVPPSVVFIGDKIISVGNNVRILISVGGIRLDEYLYYSRIQVSGVIYSSAPETVAAITKLCSVFKPGGGDGSGVSVHNQLNGRSAANTHPISSITGLEEALEKLGDGKKKVYLIDIPEGTVLPAGTIIRCDNIDVVQPNEDYYSELTFMVEKLGMSYNGFVLKIEGNKGSVKNYITINGSKDDVFEAGFDTNTPPNYGKYRENNEWLIDNPAENFWIKLVFDSELSKEYIDTIETDTFLPTLYVELPDDNGVTIQQVNAAISTHNEDESAHIEIVTDLSSTTKVLSPKLGGRYEFGALTSLELQNIPKSWNPIVIQFRCGTTLTTLTLPNDVEIIAGDVDTPNKTYELSILNGRITIV